MRRAQLGVAAAGAAILALLAAYAAARLAGSRSPDAGAPATPPGDLVGSAQVQLADPVPAAVTLLVLDGATVEASGRVIAAPGAPIKFCAPAAEALTGDNGPPDCLFWIEARGVDLDALSDRLVIGGSVVGKATLRGTWQSRVLVVTAQAPAATPGAVPAPSASGVPCPPPPGGWRRSSALPDLGALQDYIDRNSDRFTAPWIAQPEGPPGTDTAAPDFTTRPGALVVEVVVVEVVAGDVEQARAELSSIVSGNLCVTRAGPHVRSSAEASRNAAEFTERVRPLMNDPTNGVYGAGDDPSGRYRIEFVVLDQRLLDALTPIGLDNLILEPWIRPALAAAPAPAPSR